MADHSGFWCSLTATYSGNWANCVGPCHKNPCLNGGVCTDTKNDSYNCKCAGGYSGNNCEIAGQCVKKPCQNGGICTENGNNSRSCECTAGYSGENCEKKLPCPPGKKTDNHQGACCVLPFIYKGTTYNACTMADYSRLWCSLTAIYSTSWANCVGPCDKNPCLNGGFCTATKNDSYNCKCAGGYSGENCEIAGPCAKKPCQNGGICTETGNNSRSCKCAAGYSGENCEKKLPCPPGRKTDNHQGACCVFPFIYKGTTYNACTMADYSRFWCSLTPTYSSSWANCVGSCHKNPCLNGGVCTDTKNDSYNCKCTGGYSGNNCEIADPCAKKPCQNGGICTQTGNNSRSCECGAGYSGENCEKKLPCPPGKKTDNHQGACCVFPFTYGGTTYNACTMADHSGLWCSLTAAYSGSWANCVGRCDKNPCLNGGVCTETRNDSYNCKCAGGYSGDNCETGPCAKRPCQNGGICTQTGNSSRSCECTAEYSGENCEKKLPCPPGRRTDNPQGACCTFPFTYGGTTYNACTMVDHSQLWCTLKAGYSRSWANCVGPCHKNPCLNEGVCTETQNDSYNCKCAGGYSGDNCEIEGPCAKKPCQNGGICTQTGNNSRSCKCTAEYSGENCEKKLPCSTGKKTDNARGACCVFPFTYNGKTYNSCTMDPWHRLWCSLTATYSGSWANCISSCAKNPCQNGGVCAETQDNSYSCKCGAGYSGVNCEDASDGWRSEGCFKVLKKGEKIVYEKRFADINGTGEMKCNVKTAFELCKVAADEKGYEMFGILGVREMKTGRR
ncbi:fibropellin-1-like isoform X3 [Stylophora pistillata]|uniref:fibropellin-1-like isoform X3 n=1 Tax=Stylophora pistillata TaxID=50429 RepID=UPI000C03F538|nr:fibropellin-1-like isoform X3 [Stylophora pistillata]